MNQNQNSYNSPVRNRWQARFLQSFSSVVQFPNSKVALILPNWMVGAPIAAFIIAFVICTIAFGYPMPWDYACYSIGSLLLFFLGARYMLKRWKDTKERRFARNLFMWSLYIRLLWVVICYAFFNEYTYGKIDGYGDDNGWYLEFSKVMAQWLRGDITTSFAVLTQDFAMDDLGYPTWLAILYVLFFDSSDIFVPLIFKAFFSAYSCLCVYRIALRHFGEGTARLAGVFMCFNPYMLIWCSSLLKETEMVFLCCMCLDKTDETLSSGKSLNIKGLLPGMLAAFALFFFRAVLGAVAFLAIFTHVIFASRRVLSTGKKILAGILVGLFLLVGVGDRLLTQSNALFEQVRSGQQEANMEWRSKRIDEGGRTQSFAKYAGAAVFAPLIFTIPFPTFNMANEAQVLQAQLSGGNYIKNILSFFVILVFIMMLISGEWRRHVYILAYTLGYEIVLVMSNFAQSGRFHMPVWPMLILFAAYGIQLSKNSKKVQKWFTFVLVIEVVVCLAWNWFKLKGRGMI